MPTDAAAALARAKEEMDGCCPCRVKRVSLSCNNPFCEHSGDDRFIPADRPTDISCRWPGHAIFLRALAAQEWVTLDAVHGLRRVPGESRIRITTDLEDELGGMIDRARKAWEEAERGSQE